MLEPLEKEEEEEHSDDSKVDSETIIMDAISDDDKGIVNKTFQSEPEDVIVIQTNGDKKKTKPITFGKHTFHQTPALTVKNACKQYTKKSDPVLKNFSMTVEQGTIYSLLGSSGCGKTTILSCCVGLRHLDSGEILIYGAKPGTPASGVPGKRVGYMPQEIALYGEFSIKEILQYFGRLYGMTAKEVKENTEFLISFLALPPGHRRIMTLSGGQQRRVSFAVALVHNPELLILDEPTVGVDPLLRQSIWSHLCKLVSSGRTTVIITTHYIEEARDSDRIGLMRNGRLLEEASPSTLLEQHNTHLLEDIVLKLCLKDTAESSTANKRTTTDTIEETAIDEANEYLEKQKNTPTEVVVARYTRRQSSVANMRSSSTLQKRGSLADVLHRPSNAQASNIRQKEEFKELVARIYALALKNVLLLLRNITFLFFILIVPATQVVLICLAIGSDPKGIRFGLINNDWASSEECDPGSGCIMNDDFNGSLSCQFMNTFDKEIISMIPYETEEAARQDVKETKLWGTMVFPENFTQNMKDRALFGSHADLDVIIGSQVTFSLDMSNKQVGLQMKKIILETFQRFMADIADKCGINPANLDLPVHFSSPPIFGDDSTSFTEFIAPGVLLGILFFFPLCASGISFISEKKSGALDRSMVAGVKTTEVMFSYSITHLVLLIFQAGLAFGIMVLVFNIQVKGSLALTLIMSILIGVAGISVGFLLATICDDELQAVMLAMGSFFPNFILSGLFWPIEGMPKFLQYVSYILPCTLSGESMRSLISRGVDYSHPAVWPGFVSTIIWIMIYWIVTILAHKFGKKK